MSSPKTGHSCRIEKTLPSSVVNIAVASEYTSSSQKPLSALYTGEYFCAKNAMYDKCKMLALTYSVHLKALAMLKVSHVISVLPVITGVFNVLLVFYIDLFP